MAKKEKKENRTDSDGKEFIRAGIVVNVKSTDYCAWNKQ